jgi:DNA-binding transcriptional LysR family regulator
MHVLHHSLGLLEQIRSFLTVVEEGSLHRAAARLRISSQPCRVRRRLLNMN